MLYPFMTLNDGTEIVYSSPIQNGNQEQVKVQIETPVENGFKSATCILPGYLWTNNGYSEMEMASLKELVKSTAHLLIRFSHEGGILSVTFPRMLSTTRLRTSRLSLNQRSMS
mgnify:CR=1 FL=1